MNKEQVVSEVLEWVFSIVGLGDEEAVKKYFSNFHDQHLTQLQEIINEYKKGDDSFEADKNQEIGKKVGGEAEKESAVDEADKEKEADDEDDEEEDDDAHESDVEIVKDIPTKKRVQRRGKEPRPSKRAKKVKLSTEKWLEEIGDTELPDSIELPEPINETPDATKDFKKFEEDMFQEIAEFKAAEGFATRRGFILGAYFNTLSDYIDSLPTEEREGDLSSFRAYCENHCRLSTNYIFKLKDLYQQLGGYIRFQYVQVPIRELLARKKEIVSLLDGNKKLQKHWSEPNVEK